MILTHWCSEQTVERLRRRGHDVQVVDDLDDLVKILKKIDDKINEWDYEAIIVGALSAAFLFDKLKDVDLLALYEDKHGLHPV